MLKKKGIQGHFLSLNGCNVLQRWISPNPDGSLPPFQVIEEVLDILDSLPIEIDHLQSSNVAKVIQRYCSG